jgi:hypothetical protein
MPGKAAKKSFASTGFCRYISGHDLEAISLVLYASFSCLAQSSFCGAVGGEI